MISRWFAAARKGWNIRRLEVHRDRVSKNFDRKIQAAKKNVASRDDIEKLQYDDQFEWSIAQEEIARLRTSLLLIEAQRYLLPYPSEEINWEESSFDGKRHLTDEAQRALMVAIRLERKERSELLRLWVAGLTGLIGAVSGLAAVLLSHRK